MKEAIIAKRYSEAFFEYAKDSIGEKQALSELKSFKNILNENPEFKQFLEAKEIDSSDKQNFIDNVFKNIFSLDTRNFLKLLIKKDRIHYVAAIIDYAIIEYSEKEAIYTILKTSFPLDADAIQGIRNKLESRLQKKLFINQEIDKTLIGGIKIQLGNSLIDGSIRGRLNDLKRKLEQIKVG